MKLTPVSKTILDNFASINPNLYVQPGNLIKVKSPVAELVAEAELDISFPKEFGIFDMNKFLSVVNLVDNAELNFLDKSVEVFNDTSSVRYTYADKAALNIFEGEVQIPEPTVKFTLKKAELEKLIKAANLLSHQEISFTNEGGVLVAMVDTVSPMNKNVATNAFKMGLDVPVPVDSDFRYVVKLSHLVMLPGDYEVSFAHIKKSAFFAKFKLAGYPNLTYYMGLPKKECYVNG